MDGNERKPMIRQVTDKKDKQNTYESQVARYDKAMKHGFCLEAILIMYACLEDRLLYMLYYLGLLTNEQKFAVGQGRSERVRSFRSIVRRYLGENADLSVMGIKKKRLLVASIMQTVLEENTAPESKVEALLRQKLNDRDRIGDILSLLGEIEEWCKYRNEVIHSLLNKNIGSLNEQLAIQAQRGKELFRRLDAHVRWVKRKKIRGGLRLPE